MAIEQAKLPTETKHRQVLIREIQEKARKLKRVPKLTDFTSPQRFYTAFGSWNNALGSAGFPLARKTTTRLVSRYIQGQRHKTTKKECAKALKRLSDMLGGYRPTAADIDSDLGAEAGCPRTATIDRRFRGFDKALQAAGIGHLLTKHEETRSKEETAIVKTLENKPFSLSPDFSLRQKRVARKNGIPIVRKTKSCELNIVLGWMRGQAYEGVLPKESEIAFGMGERAYQYLCVYCQGVTMAKIGERNRLTRERVRQILTRRAADLVRSILGERRTVHVADSGRQCSRKASRARS